MSKPTNKEHLQLFANQLCTWSEQIIENGRTPFRRVDLFHQLQTAAGPCSPPLIFWINRQSMIAGGLLFLPDSSAKDYRTEAAAAAALGLKHFVTWETDQINIWQTGKDGIDRLKSLPLTTTADPAVFHHRLYEIIDLLKLLSVTGRVETGAISPYYLLNLLNETLALANQGFIEHSRLLRNEKTSHLPAAQEAEDWNRLSLLRLLCLLNWQQLPHNLTSENLAQTLDELLPKLPDPLGTCLHTLSPPPHQKLPTGSAVAFHHLLLRLQQVGWQEQGPRNTQVLRLLLTQWYGAKGDGTHSGVNPRLIFHSRELAPACQREVSHSSAQLASNTLWRLLEEKPHPEQHQGDAFHFAEPFAEQSLHANFFGDLRPDPALRRELSGHLRISWPNRRLTIPGDLPAWVSEAAHLLGLCNTDSRIELHLPDNWLRLVRGTFFNDLLFENFALIMIDTSASGRHLLTLQRNRDEILTRCLLADGERRTLELGPDPKQACERLLYALELPASPYALFADQQLVPVSADSFKVNHEQALRYYAASRIGRLLWSFCSQAQQPQQFEELLRTAEKAGWLVPDAIHLNELEHLLSTAGKETSKGSDDLLTQLFGREVDADLDSSSAILPSKTETRPLNRTLGEELLRQLEVEGVPHFPNTYLYRQATGPLHSYNFTPPLELRQEMLGQYELLDAKEKILEVCGEETKDALMLASLLEMNSLELPLDRQQTAEMLDSYRQDLKLLQIKMETLCQRHIEDPQTAIRLQKKLWQQLPLPPFKWLSS